MAEIEVEAVETIDAPVGIDAPECVLYGGKGGVGKTTMAAATARASARDGTPTLVVSTDPAHSLADTFEQPVPSEPTQLSDSFPLYAAAIDPDESMATEFGGIAGLGGDNPLSEFLGDAVMPGADEAVALQQLMRYLNDDRFDRVIVDTAPTGHTLRLLNLPEMLDTMAGRLVTMRERLSGLFESAGGIFGEDGASTSGPSLDEFREQIEQLRAVLRDPDRTDFRLVVVPETMSVDESERLLEDLEAQEIPVGTIVVNRIMENPEAIADDLESELLATPNHETCEFCRQRWEVQRTALERAQPLFRGRTVKRVPLLAAEVRGETMLDFVAACLD